MDRDGLKNNRLQFVEKSIAFYLYTLFLLFQTCHEILQLVHNYY